MWRVANRRRGAEGVYVGRPSPLGNPFPAEIEALRSEAIERFRAWLWRRLQSDTPQRREIERLAALEDGTLVCWCAPKPCHADVIVRAIEWTRSQKGRPMTPAEFIAKYDPKSEDLDGIVHDLKQEEASELNNQGTLAQLEFILNRLDASQLAAELADQLQEKVDDMEYA